MHRLKNRGIVVLAVLGLFAFSGIAMADTEDDTVFNYGYDADNYFFIWNVTSLDFDDGYESIDDLQQCKLQPDEEEDPVTYDYAVDGDSITLTEKPEDATETPEPIDFADLGCNEPSGGSVLGPAQQVNHGMFLRMFNMMYDGEGNRGCLVRHIAQSDLGKGEQQKEADPEASDPVPVTDGEVSFTSVEADCIKGDKESDNGNGKGRPDWAGNGKPDWAGEGKPDHAGGRP